MAELTRRRGRTGYLLIAPGAVFLLLFFVFPFYSLIATSLHHFVIHIAQKLLLRAQH